MGLPSIRELGPIERLRCAPALAGASLFCHDGRSLMRPASIRELVPLGRLRFAPAPARFATAPAPHVNCGTMAMFAFGRLMREIDKQEVALR